MEQEILQAYKRLNSIEKVAEELNLPISWVKIVCK